MAVIRQRAASFDGEDENSNKELGAFARLLRTLTALWGHPAVIANCHPAKAATADNLIPRGGGALRLIFSLFREVISQPRHAAIAHPDIQVLPFNEGR
jgi:hypothetical protein